MIRFMHDTAINIETENTNIFNIFKNNIVSNYN